MKTPNASRFFRCSLLAALAFSLTAGLYAQEKSKLSAGQKVPAFEAKTTEGKAVKFPDTYKGKVVLLDFWATWCPPCRDEVPNVVEAYKQFHAKGFEVLGISLDRPNSSEQLAKFTKDKGMSWPQIYDGKAWQAAVAEKYGINSIPEPILIDGDTGLILAEGSDARGSNLGPAIEKALAAKKNKTTS